MTIIKDLITRLLATAAALTAIAVLALQLSLLESPTKNIVVCESLLLASETIIGGADALTEQAISELELTDCELIEIEKGDELIAEIAIDEGESIGLKARQLATR